MAWPKGKPRKPVEGAVHAAPSPFQGVENMAEVRTETDMIEVEVKRDLWDDNGERRRGPYTEYTGETYFDADKGKMVRKTRQVPGEIIKLPRDLARKFRDSGVVEIHV